MLLPYFYFVVRFNCVCIINDFMHLLELELHLQM